ncbi:MAG: hypothetical protein HRU25_11870 [Psychrobium sp.]|nr:hypothetical protein [Psychrobium sp.]
MKARKSILLMAGFRVSGRYQMKISNVIAVLVPLFVLVFVYVGVQSEPGIVQSISYKSFMSMFACLGLWSVLRISDWVSGVDFKEWWLLSNVDQKSHYLRIRFASYAVVFSFIFAFA